MTSRILLSGLFVSSLVACTAGKDTEEAPDTNNAPVANAGADLVVSSDDTIVLDGAGSYDPDGDAFNLHWSFNRVPAESALAGTDPFPNNHTDTKTSELRPDVPGTYIIDLQVEDARGARSDVDSVVVTVEPGENPVANAGGNQDVVAGASVTLDGSGSYDPLGRALTYTWALASAPANSGVSELSVTDQMTTSFTPDVGGRFVVSLQVNNGMSDSEPNLAYIDVATDKPQAPVADAGEDNNGAMDCSYVGLDGTDSFDPNGDILQYEWTLQEKPENSTTSNSEIADRTAESTTFYPDVAGEYTVSLAVKDNDGWSTPDLVKIQANERTFNTAPEVEAGKSQNVDGGTAPCTEQGYTYDCDSCSAVNVQLGLDAFVTDADNDQVSLSWSSASEDADVSILDSSALQTTVQVAGAAPIEPLSCTDTEFIFELSAVDCPGAVGSDQVSVVVTCCGVAPPDSGS